MTKRLRVGVFFFGGTIACRTDGHIRRESCHPQHLFSSYTNVDLSFFFVLDHVCLSENHTLSDYLALFGLLRREAPALDALLIVTGTDTLAYLAQLCARLLPHLLRPFVLVASHLVPDDPLSDAPHNLSCALHVLQIATTGGFVVDGHSQTIAFLFHAADVMCPAQGDHYLRSFMGRPFFVFDNTPEKDDRLLLSFLRAQESLSPMLYPRKDVDPKRFVLVLDAYVGADYRALDVSSSHLIAVLHRLYHSATACSLDPDHPQSLLFLKKRCDAHHIPLYVAPICRSSPLYASTDRFISFGICTMDDMPLEAVWAQLIANDWCRTT